MKLQGFIKKQPVVMLLDTGSTHNFINYSTAKNLGCKQPMPQMHVSVANGEKVIAHSKCMGLQWQIQGEHFQDEFIVIPLTGCDVVLGIQWFSPKKQVLWDYDKSQIQFQQGERTVLLQALQVALVQLTEGKNLSKLIATGTQVILTQIQLLNTTASNSTSLN
ncbi:Transposon Ty3-I Gag-Pol polyprotein [Quillaja saponaria]|uniref:Transposon Ty3-I Gag-Pol polyprotein n=1 Tax=Quillaja saponaria TaxID=32244 RepID=A0AAD7LH02_QUISA|nr:Transposon Ty3-I Gag-Pol polyprotein [Quillaja saponaria]